MEILVEYQYDAWGNIIEVKTSSTHSVEAQRVLDSNRYFYRGYRYDEETNLYYLNSRYYNPVIHRFINADGLLGQQGNILGHNMYSYTSNNPVMYLDISGEFPVLIACIIVGALIGGAVGAVVGLGYVAMVAGFKSVAHKAIADYTAYSLYGKSFGGFEDYAVAFAFGGLTKGLNITGINKLALNSVGRALVYQGTEILLHGEEFNIGKFGIDVFRRSIAAGLPQGSRALFKGVMSGAYDKYSQQGYMPYPLLRFDYT